MNIGIRSSKILLKNGHQLVDLSHSKQSLLAASVNSGDEVLVDIVNNCILLSDIIRDVSFVFLTTIPLSFCVISVSRILGTS